MAYYSGLPGNPSATPSDYARLITTLPKHIVNSWDWATRCAWQPDYLKRPMPRGMSFVKAVTQRIEMVDMNPSLEPVFDLSAARRPCEVAYTGRLRGVTGDLLSQCGSVDARLLCFDEHFFKRDGFPRSNVRELEVLLPHEKKWERQMRHKTGYFVPCHQREAFCFNRRGLAATCVPVPEWFGPFEVHYGLHVETPPVITYHGSSLMQGPQHRLWPVFLTEWSALVAFELMYQARQGRVHYIPPAVRRAIRDVGCQVIMQGNHALTDQLELLLREIDLIRWSEVSPRNRSLPEQAGNLHVPITGTWVDFNTDDWESQMPSEMYLDEDTIRVGDELDYPRGTLTGLIDQRSEAERTTRPVISGDEKDVPLKYRLLELKASTAGEASERTPQAPYLRGDGMPNLRAQARAARILNKIMERAGLKRLLAEYGYPDGISLDQAADMNRLHLTRREGPRVEARPSPSPSNERRLPTISEEFDAMQMAEEKAAKEVVKEEAVLPPTPAIVQPRKRAHVEQASGSRSKPSASTNRRITDDVVDLVSASETESGTSEKAPAGAASQA